MACEDNDGSQLRSRRATSLLLHRHLEKSGRGDEANMLHVPTKLIKGCIHLHYIDTYNYMAVLIIFDRDGELPLHKPASNYSVRI